MNKYVQQKDGDVILPKKFGKRWLHKIACCDCGLVHRFAFTVIADKKGKQHLAFTAIRDNRATSARRRGRQSLTPESPDA